MEKFLERIIIKAIKFLKANPKRLFTIFFMPILILSSVNMIDFFFIPKIETTDQIVSRRKLYRNNSYGRTVVGCKYKTAKGFSFSTSEAIIRENDIDIKHTQIFKSVTFVDSDRKDYTEKLSSNLNGILKYFHLLFLSSLVIGIIIFISERQISQNTYLNIIIFNALIFVVLLYMLFFY